MITPQQFRNPQVKPKWQVPVGVMESIVAFNCRKYGMPRPVLAMPMWEGAGNRALDLSGHGNHGTFIGTPTWNTDGLYLNGTDASVDTGRWSNYIQYITVSAWVNPDTTVRGDIVARWGNVEYKYVLLQGVTTGKFEFFISRNGASAESSGNSITTFSTGTWYHVIGTYDGVNAKIFVNGIVENSTGYTGTLYSSPDINDTIGLGDILYEGSIKNVSVYNSGLTHTQAKFLYENPYFMYQIPEELYGYVSAVGDTATNLLHGKIIIKDSSIILVDGLIKVQDISTDLFDGELKVIEKETSLADGKLQVQDTATNLADGKLQVKDSATSLADGKVQIQDTDTDLADGKIKVQDSATDLADGKVQIQDSVTDLADGKVIVTTTTTATDLADGKVIVITAGQDTGYADGKIQIKDVTTGIVDGLVKVKDSVTGLADGKVKIGNIGSTLADGKIQIKDVTAGIVDGLVKVKDSVTGLADGKVKIGNIGSNLVDGLIGIKDAVSGLIDGKLTISSGVSTAINKFNALLQIPARYRIISSSESQHSIVTSSESQHNISIIRDDE